MSTALNGRVKRLEAIRAEIAGRPPARRWWEGVPELVLAYLVAQPPEVAAAFNRHLEWMQDLPGNRDGFRYYQVLTRPWRPGERRFVAPALMVYDAIFDLGDALTTGEARVRVLACGYHNLLDATPDAGSTPVHGAGRDTAWARKVAGVWARLAGGPLCDSPSCLCFASTGWRCRNPAEVVAAWRARGTIGPDTLAAMGFGEPELALLATDDEAEEGASDAA